MMINLVGRLVGLNSALHRIIKYAFSWPPIILISLYRSSQGGKNGWLSRMILENFWYVQLVENISCHDALLISIYQQHAESDFT
jgi:hypothetical protein